MTSLNLHPPKNYGMKSLDKSLFEVKRTVWALLLQDLTQVGEFLGKKNSKALALKIPSYPPMVPFPRDQLTTEEAELLQKTNPKFKALLIDPVYTNSAKEAHCELVLSQENQHLSDKLAQIQHIFKPFEMTFGYSYWSHDQILKSILPTELHENCPTSFTIAGHLAHLNLKDDYLPYKNIIGEVILSKYPNIKTVVNKSNVITSEFRTFEMELLAGEDNFVVTQRESNCQFKFDFAKVYWNSRLSTEHDRLINSFQPGEAICDVMAGVGPFAVPAGKKKVLVFANDLNPQSYKYLNENIKLNKVETYVKSFNQDGADFIKNSAKLLWDFQTENKDNKKFVKSSSNNNKRHKITNDSTPSTQFFSQYIMNLPDSAMTFLPNYISLFSRNFPNMSKQEIMNLPGFKLPIINVHHFEKYKEEDMQDKNLNDELLKIITQKVKSYLKYDKDDIIINLHVVRQVAPCKLMFCVAVTLPEEVAFRPL